MNKNFKYFFYVFIISVIGIFVMAYGFKDQPWSKTLMIIFIVIAAIIFIAYLVSMLFCYLDSKKLDRMLVIDDYQAVIKHCQKERKIIELFLPERITYYEYLLLLSYFALDDSEKIDSYLIKFENKMDLYPMILYWKSCYEFSKENYDNIKDYKDKFVNSFDVIRQQERYQNLINVLEILILYIDKKVEEAKELLTKIDMNQISMPSTLKALKIIENSN